MKTRESNDENNGVVEWLSQKGKSVFSFFARSEQQKEEKNKMQKEINQIRSNVDKYCQTIEEITNEVDFMRDMYKAKASDLKNENEKLKAEIEKFQEHPIMKKIRQRAINGNNPKTTMRSDPGEIEITELSNAFQQLVSTYPEYTADKLNELSVFDDQVKQHHSAVCNMFDKYCEMSERQQKKVEEKLEFYSHKI